MFFFLTHSLCTFHILFFWRTLPMVDSSSPLFDTFAAAVLHRSTKPNKPKKPHWFFLPVSGQNVLVKRRKTHWSAISDHARTIPVLWSGGTRSRRHGWPRWSWRLCNQLNDLTRASLWQSAPFILVHLEQLRLVFINHWVTDRPVWLILLEKARNRTTNRCYSTRTIQEPVAIFHFCLIFHSLFFFSAFLINTFLRSGC